MSDSDRQAREDRVRSCILVVDDDEALRSLLASLLRSRGYEVLEASDGSEGLESARRRLREILLVLSDVCMPGMTGIDLARQLTEVQPAIRVVLMSGTETGALAMKRGWTFLQKPFSPCALLQTVRQVLSAPED